MITRNFRELLALVLCSVSTVYGSRPVKDTNGRMWYATPQFTFPGTITTATTLTASAAGISVGRGTAPATENDYRLEDPITGGVTLTLTATKAGCDSPGDPYVEHYVTVTNTGDTAITVTEIGYKQRMKAAIRPAGTSSGDITVLLDHTILSSPMTVQAGDAGVIIYRLKTSPTSGKTVQGVKIVDFAYGTDAEIAAMIDAAAAGTIDLQTDGGWRVGDQRKIHLDAWTGGDGVAHAAEDLTIVISSFEEYNGCGNLFQFDFMDCCTASQRLNSTNTTSGGYGATEMYTTTLPAMAEALPGWLRSRLKTFDVLASKGGSELTTIETVAGNKLALRSEVEVIGYTSNSQPGEGVQVEYYKVAAVRVKTRGFSGSATNWWTRSAYISSYFCYNTGNGSTGSVSPTNTFGVSPFGCI